MPVYEYECTKCGDHQEVFQKLSDRPLKKCSHCSGRLNKLISHSAFHLKGSGWYVTDYANASKSAASPEKKPAGENSPAKETKQTESKSTES